MELDTLFNNTTAWVSSTHRVGLIVKAFEPASFRGANSTPLKLGLFNCSQSPKYSKVFLERNQFFTTSLGSTGFFSLAISVMQM